MGQRKTWAMHHVPFSMFWETFTINNKNNWNSVICSFTANQYLSAQYDKNYWKKKFAFIWKSNYFNLKNYTFNRVFTQQYKLKKKNLFFNWVINANKGSNETSCNKIYYIEINSECILLSFFFRQYINFQNLNKYKKIKNNALIFKFNLLNTEFLDLFITKHVNIKNKFFFKKSKRIYKLQNLQFLLNGFNRNIQFTSFNYQIQTLNQIFQLFDLKTLSTKRKIKLINNLNKIKNININYLIKIFKWKKINNYLLLKNYKNIITSYFL